MTRPVTALSAIRILDLADEAGAYCPKLLADMGADVIAVEPPGGRVMRRIAPFHGGRAGPNRSRFFWYYNTSKRGVTLDLDSSSDRQQFVRLAATADVIVETFPPGHLDSLGLGYAALSAHHPRLTLVSITPFGQAGPSRAWRGSDLIGQASGGMVYVNGCEDAAPLQGLGLQAYHSASTYAAIGILLALRAREHSGRGQWVDVSVQECVAAMLEHASGFFHQDGTIATRSGALHWSRDFHLCRCRDGHVVLSTLCDWTSLVEWLRADGKAQDLVDTAWEDFNYRRAHCHHLFAVLDEWAAGYAVADLVERAQLLRFPWAPVLGPERLQHNAQLLDRKFFVPVSHPELGKDVLYPGAPYLFSKTPWRIQRRPPLVGEHSAGIFAELQGSGLRPLPVSPLAAEAVDLPDSRRSTLQGVRVIDFSWVIAGPVATRILADHGAEVIKIERRDALDFGSRRGGLTGNLNRGKQSVVLDMNDWRGVELARALVATADVVVDNFSARVMRNWGLDYDHLRRLKPDIIALNMSGFGQTGPQRDYVSYGPTLQALAGYTSLMRHPGAAPAGWGFSYSDMAAGCSGALALLMALWHRQRTGEGQCIDLSQFENLVVLLGPLLLNILADDRGAVPVANASQELPAAPHGVYRCGDAPEDGPGRDRWCAVAVFGAEDWSRFRQVLGDPAWASDQRFATACARATHRDALDAHIADWTRGRVAEEVVCSLQRAGIAAGLVANAADLCGRDRHLQARGNWTKVRTAEGESVEFDGIPVRLSATPGQVRSAGPRLGEHTDAVLQRLLKLSAATIAELRAAKVIA